MSGEWIRVPPERGDTVRSLLAAGVMAAGAGLVTFYLTRLLLARERLSSKGPPGPTQGAHDEGGGA